MEQVDFVRNVLTVVMFIPACDEGEAMFSPDTGEITQICRNSIFYQIANFTATTSSEITDEGEQIELRGISQLLVIVLAAACGLLITVLIAMLFLVSVVIVWARKKSKKNVQINTNVAYKV